MFAFDWQSWVILVMIGIITISSQNVKLIAFRYEDPSKLQTIAFLPTIWQFAIDWIVLNAAFTAQQFWGFGLLFAFNFVELVRFNLNQRRKEREESDDYLLLSTVDRGQQAKPTLTL
jgi:hypothetical protein